MFLRFVDHVVVESKAKGMKHYFPVHRWIKAKGKFYVSEYDSCLPADDKYPVQRAKELERKQLQYELTENAPGLPMQVCSDAHAGTVALVPNRWVRTPKGVSGLC